MTAIDPRDPAEGLRPAVAPDAPDATGAAQPGAEREHRHHHYQHGRHHRHRRRGWRRHRRLILGSGAVAAVLVLLAVIGAIRYLPLLDDAKALKAEVADAAHRAQAAGLQMDRPTLDRLTADLDDASRRLDGLADMVGHDPLIALLRILPPTRPQAEGADGIVAAGRDLVQAGRDGLAVGARYVAIRESHAADPAKRSAMAELVELMATSTSQASDAAQAVDRAKVRLAALPGGLVGPLADARDLLRQRVDQFGPALDAYVKADDVLPAILGWGSPRRYLVLAEDPAELRASGGFGGTYGLVTFDAGRITQKSFKNTLNLDLRPGWQQAPYVEPPAGLKEHLLGRYPWQLADAAWSPDFPTAAQDALRLYTLESGDSRVDGVIALTTYGIDDILAVTGPIAVPEYGVTVKSGETTLTALQNTRVSRQAGVDRKAFLDVFAGKLLDSLLALPTNKWPELLDQLQVVGRERQAAAWFKDAGAQKLVADASFDGAVRQDAGDFVMAVDSNVSPTSKYNLITTRSQSLDVSLDALGNATDTLDLRWDNAYAGPAGDPLRALKYVGENGMLGDYVRVLTADRSRLRSVTGGSYVQLTVPEAVAQIVGRTSFANFLLIPPGTTHLQYRWISPYPADQDREGGIYRLTVQKQPGTVADPLQVRITVPDGAVIVETSPGLTVSGRLATLSTALSQDIRVFVRYRFQTH